MPLYIRPVDWSAPERGFAYTKEEFDKRIAANIEAMGLVAGTREHAIIHETNFMELDVLFNNAPN